jgi:hypothetical protein
MERAVEGVVLVGKQYHYRTVITSITNSHLALDILVQVTRKKCFV